MTSVDPIRWWDAEVGCSRCGTNASRYVPPYWARDRRVCPACCAELNYLFDTTNGWPAESVPDPAPPKGHP